MPKLLTASDSKALVKLAGTLPKGSAERKAILAGLQKTSNPLQLWSRALGKRIKAGLGDSLKEAHSLVFEQMTDAPTGSEEFRLLTGIRKSLDDIENFIDRKIAS